MYNKRSSTARIVSIIVLFGIIPSWFFYLGVHFIKTLTVITNNQNTAQNYLQK